MTTQLVTAPQIELCFYIRLDGVNSSYTITDSRIKDTHLVVVHQFRNAAIITLCGDITTESISNGSCKLRYSVKASTSRILVYFIRMPIIDLT